MELLLSDTNTYKLLNTDPTNAVNLNFSKELRSIVKDKTLQKKLVVFCPKLPHMYGLIKTHKPNNPIRPIVSSIGSAVYNLAKYLVKVLQPMVGSVSNSHVKNSHDLVLQLKDLNVNYEYILISFDVESLFTKVPVNDFIDFLKNELQNYELELPNDIIILLIELCIKNCYFSFNNKFYLQLLGMPMGNPLSALIANLYMEFFEKYILSTILRSDIIWKRYVDDILVFWPKNLDVNGFLDQLNSLVNSIKFTLEIENNFKLSFLDVNIHRTNNDLKFNVYRKPTNNELYIHNYSFHEYKVKQSIFLSMYIRAFRICSPEFLQEEINHIFKCGRKLCYEDNFLEKAYKKAKYIVNNQRVKEKIRKNNEAVLVLPYHKQLECIKPLLRTLNISLIFNYKNTLSNLLINNAPKSDINNCIYKIPCKICNQYYIGQTKNINERIKQHKYSVRTCNENNTCFKHMEIYGHQIDWENTDIILRKNDIKLRNIYESAIIQKT